MGAQPLQASAASPLARPLLDSCSPGQALGPFLLNKGSPAIASKASACGARPHPVDPLGTDCLTTTEPLPASQGAAQLPPALTGLSGSCSSDLASAFLFHIQQGEEHKEGAAQKIPSVPPCSQPALSPHPQWAASAAVFLVKPRQPFLGCWGGSERARSSQRRTVTRGRVRL